MLKPDDIKVALHQKFDSLDKLLMVLATLDTGVSIAAIKDQARRIGFRTPAAWNCSDLLGRSKGAAVRTHLGWEITDLGWERLAKLGLARYTQRPAVYRMHASLVEIVDDDLREYMEEAVGCAQAGYMKAAIVLSWSAAIYALQDYVCRESLSAFNSCARGVLPKWKDARHPEDLGVMKERDFLDRLENVGIITGSVKKALIECLDRRNSCGHPTKVRFSSATVDHHVEIIAKNVIEPFTVRRVSSAA